MELTQWLDHIAQVHPREIELGLERCQRVATLLGIKKSPVVITVAGTNGKGSTVGVMEQLLCQAGVAVGSYTSPHIDRFNERIRLQGQLASDAMISDAFARIEAARGEVSLSYFEFATLAALLIFQQQAVEVAVLEVGLGGRLDAVNIIDPDVSVITSIGLDHQDWLGHDRDTISLEKAGILRPGGWFVCADTDPPVALQQRASTLECRALYVGHDFQIIDSGSENRWNWQGQSLDGAALTLVCPSFSGLQPENVAAALQALVIAAPELDWGSYTAANTNDQPWKPIPGRQEMRCDRDSGRRVLFDVAHNPDAITALAGAIGELRDSGRVQGRVHIVLAIMADKDVESMLTALESEVDIWYIAQVEEPRCMPAVEIGNRLQRLTSTGSMTCFESVQDAYRAACVEAAEDDLVVVAGSFFTVAAVRSFSLDQESNCI